MAALRDAEWLNGRRARVYPRLLLAASVGLALIWIVAARGGVDLAGKPLGTDFLSFFAASELALQGRAAQAYDVSAHWAAQKALFGPAVGYSAFFYPPPYLLVCLPLALMPYFASLIVWLAATGYAYWRVLRAWAGPRVGRRGPARFPRLPGQRRPRAERLLERGADRRRRAVRSTDGRSSPACCSARSSTSRNWR